VRHKSLFPVCFSLHSSSFLSLTDVFSPFTYLSPFLSLFSCLFFSSAYSLTVLKPTDLITGKSRAHAALNQPSEGPRKKIRNKEKRRGRRREEGREERMFFFTRRDAIGLNAAVKVVAVKASALILAIRSKTSGAETTT
jgi:hypothetical protein